VFAAGAQGFYTVIYTTLIYPLLFVVLTRFWIVARHRGYVTTADFVRERFGSHAALIVALTGILAAMPYLAVQMYGIEVVIAQMGIPIEASLIIAFLLLSLCTYVSGLRASAIIAFIKRGTQYTAFGVDTLVQVYA
jgi:SSS family solute:Na+ symporter